MDDTPSELRIKCSMCGEEHFTSREVLLNAPGMTFFGLDWLNASAKVLVCSNCGHLEWFLRSAVAAKPQANAEYLNEDVDPLKQFEDASEEIPCLACGTTISAGVDRCTACGWSYKDPVVSEE